MFENSKEEKSEETPLSSKWRNEWVGICMGYVYGQDRQGVALPSAWGWDPRRDSVWPGGQLQWNGSPGLPGWMGLLPPQIEGLYF